MTKLAPASGRRRAMLAAALRLMLGAMLPQAQAASDKASSRSTGAAADLVLVNGVVYTMDDRRPTVQAVAARAGRIVYVGTDDGARRLAAARARIIDLRGKTMLPGLADSHIHPALGEFVKRRLCNVRAFTMAEVHAKIAQCAAAAPPGDWVAVYGLDLTGNPGFAAINRGALDTLVPDRRLAVISLDMHTAWVNSKTLAYLFISRDTPDPVAGKIDRDPATREPTGALHDSAWAKLYDDLVHASPYAASTAELLRTVMPYLNSLGITSILDAYVDDAAEAAYRRLDAEGKLPMRVSLAFVVTAANFRTAIPRIAAKRAKRSPHLRIDYLKLFADGNAEDKLAYLLGEDGQPTPSSWGYFTQREMDGAVRLAERHGLSVYVHSIGDGAARQTLDAIAAARRDSQCPHCRHTLTHLQWIRPSDIARMKELGVIANVQEGWLSPRAYGGPPDYDYRRDLSGGSRGPRARRAHVPVPAAARGGRAPVRRQRLVLHRGEPLDRHRGRHHLARARCRELRRHVAGQHPGSCDLAACAHPGCRVLDV